MVLQGLRGRILNQNFIRMNITTTIAWSLIWSVYPNWPYDGNGCVSVRSFKLLLMPTQG